MPPVVANDNRRPAGRLEGGTLKLSLRAARGSWQPEGPDGPRLSIEAFGEDASPLSVPAPLIRTGAGTLIDVTLRNDPDAPLQVRGLCARDGACVPLAVPPRDVRRVQFRIDRPGTYHYWATTIGAPVPFRELAGGLVIDPPGASGDDRVLVITEWTSLTPSQLGEVIRADDPGKVFVGMKPRVTFVINGLSWSATERLTYRVGESARWRVINLSSQPHPMHLHGFYFQVDGIGDGLKDTPIAPADRHPVVTHLLPSGTTMSMTWIPERAGNWLFHCHLMLAGSRDEIGHGARHQHLTGVSMAAHAPRALDGNPAHAFIGRDVAFAGVQAEGRDASEPGARRGKRPRTGNRPGRAVEGRDELTRAERERAAAEPGHFALHVRLEGQARFIVCILGLNPRPQDRREARFGSGSCAVEPRNEPMQSSIASWSPTKGRWSSPGNSTNCAPGTRLAT
jgi:hypothetical protein